MAKNPEAAKYVSDMSRAQDAARAANEGLIKLSQRFGRMVPRFQKIDHTALGIFPWIASFSKIKDCANQADAEIAPLLESEEVANNPVLQSLLAYYSTQRARYLSKVEVMDDILGGLVEDLMENGSFDDMQKADLRRAFDGTLEKSRWRAEPSMPSLS